MAKNKGGRPTLLNQELADRICELVSTTPKSLISICKENDDLPDQDTIMTWRNKHGWFADQYSVAKKEQIEAFMEDIVHISDSSDNDTFTSLDGEIKVNSAAVARSKLRVDTRKWLASKLAPKIYGDQKTLDELRGQNSDLSDELKKLREELDAKNGKDY